MWGRLYGLIGKEFAQMLRDPVMLFLIFWLTTSEVAMCTMAVGMDVKNLKLGLIDNDRTETSRAFSRELTSADTFIEAGAFASERQAEAGLRKGALDAVVEIPPDFGARVAAGRPTSIGVVVDGSNADVASRARAYIIEMTSRFAGERVMGSMPMRAGVQPAVRVWYNPNLTNTNFIALAMIAQAGFMLAVVLPAAGMVREKQNGTLEQIRVTPIRAHEMFIGKILPPVTISTGAMFPSLLVARLLNVPVGDGALTFLALNLVFLLSAVSIGVFVATVTNTLQQALLTSFFSLFPLLFLSGSVTPIESMPGWLQIASQASPLRHGIAIVTGLFLKGAGMGELWPHAAALGLIGAPLFAGSWLLFRRQW
ncbi:ABC transporter permease [Phenylobacterium soli]|uniref:Transport permease protein n=1 Tax=Phenylobacterium soli TaxID=2170551 RepID=A0A328AHX1_9CAUL|nr:ABC transporter permease [Phenylobacterium soli]RAK54117.1 ABC transporter permease [Phenylobacterium soli]